MNRSELTMQDVERATEELMVKRASSRPPPMVAGLASVSPPPRSFRPCPQCGGQGFVPDPKAPGGMGLECSACAGIGW